MNCQKFEPFNYDPLLNENNLKIKEEGEFIVVDMC